MFEQCQVHSARCPACHQLNEVRCKKPFPSARRNSLRTQPKNFLRPMNYRPLLKSSSVVKLSSALFDDHVVCPSLQSNVAVKIRFRLFAPINSVKPCASSPSIVLMEYFGYLRRDPDEAGFNFWLDVLNNRTPGNYRSMVCAFITSREYQLRFSPVATRTTESVNNSRASLKASGVDGQSTPLAQTFNP